MRQAMRRAIGIGGATFVAVGAALALTLPASAHEASATPGCATDGHATILIKTLKDYDTNTPTANPNSVTVTEGNVVVAAKDPFAKSYHKTVTLDGTTAHSVVVHFQAWDDPTGSKGWTVDIPVRTTVCENNHPTTTTPPPTTTTTTAPPTTTTAPTTQPTTTSPTTTTAVVAGVTTNGSGTLPFTGVNAMFPLLIAGVLVVAGGGILLWLRLAARRRRTE